jgi:hypothetical protein
MQEGENVRTVKRDAAVAWVKNVTQRRKGLAEGLEELLIFIRENQNDIGAYSFIALGREGQALVSRELMRPTEGVAVYGFVTNTEKTALAGRLEAWSERIKNEDIDVYSNYRVI